MIIRYHDDDDTNEGSNNNKSSRSSSSSSNSNSNSSSSNNNNNNNNNYEEMRPTPCAPYAIIRGVGSRVVSESALRSAGTLLSRVQAPLPAPWPDGGPKSLR
ncbi:hypothetical protein PoB_004896700 [Plakobranchus ocellatus]|uniref:Uncharacterized protein n=1 Tax=Plakobranchus ocellatus TaxID=259542 RepID=A0AAV4BST0_9GAST|nr:hypothetical protein PoB_004896700 [Plakobranchus ocellatus]